MRKNAPPNLKLEDRTVPYQKITITNMPIELFDELFERAQGFSHKINTYCRIVLEHAEDSKNRGDYHGKIENKFDSSAGAYGKSVNIPIRDKEFMTSLQKWDPFGVNSKKAIALSLLKKHLDVRDW